METVPGYDFETLKVTAPREMVYNVELNRPNKLNAMNSVFWREMPACFNKIATDPDCRVVVLSAAGRVFTAGLDLGDATILKGSDMEIGRRATSSRRKIQELQQSFTVLEKCLKPVIAAVHNACVGGGIDMITSCDVRYCTEDAWFQVKEVDIGLAADLGTLQRLAKVVGSDSLTRELCYTARRLQSSEAKEYGLVSCVFKDRESLMAGALETASLIASKSPIAIQGTKACLVYSRDHSVEDGLNHVAIWNQAMLLSEDVMTAGMASLNKEKATFSKL